MHALNDQWDKGRLDRVFCKEIPEEIGNAKGHIEGISPRGCTQKIGETDFPEKTGDPAERRTQGKAEQGAQHPSDVLWGVRDFLHNFFQNVHEFP